MRYLLLGLVLVYSAAAGIVAASMDRYMRTNFFWIDDNSIIVAVLFSAVIPIAASLLITDALDRLRPRLIFDPRTPRRLRATIAGAGTGVLGVLLGAAAIMFFEHIAHEGLLLALGAAVAPIPVHALLTPRRRRDSCLACGYDLSGTARQCPECGAVASRA